MPHRLIVLEGLDRSGKTTVSTILEHRLQSCTVIRFPNRSNETGRLLDRFLQRRMELTPKMTHLLYSANRYEEEENIKRMLEKGDVVCDRYWLSGAVYSAAKGLDFEWCRATDKLLRRADFTFFIDISAERTSQRMEFGNEVHDSVEFQRRVYEIYKSRAEEEGLILINGEQCVEKIAEDILGHLKEVV